MNVKELRKELANLPDEAVVFCIWDGEPRSLITNVWLSRDGRAMLCSSYAVVYSSEARPVWAPGDEDRYWDSPAIVWPSDSTQSQSEP